MPFAKLRICTKWRANWIGPAIRKYCSITRSHLERALWLQDNDRRYTCKLCPMDIKSKEEKHVIQLMSWPAQSANLNPIELAYDELNQKVRAKQPTSDAHLWQHLQESWGELSSLYLQLLVEKFYESHLKQCHSGQVESFWWMKSGNISWHSFSLICIWSWPGRLVISIINKTIVSLSCFIKNNTFRTKKKIFWGWPNTFDL